MNSLDFSDMSLKLSIGAFIRHPHLQPPLNRNTYPEQEQQKREA